jgi:hypothetical protein
MSTNYTPEAGDEVFDINGQSASYLAKSADGHVVQPIYEHEDHEEPQYGSPKVWREVFRTAPTEKVHGEIAALQNRLAIYQADLDAVRKMRADEDREYTQRVASRKQFAQLQKLDDYIAGKITHFVVQRSYSDSVSIETFDSFIKSTEDRYERKLRLLSLYGDSKGNLSWNVDRYSDGSGNDSGYYWPATSYEEAMQKAAEWLDARYAEWRKATDHNRNKSAVYAACAIKLGLVVPDDVSADAARVAAIVDESRLKSAREAFAKAKTELENALAKATGAT